MIVYYSLQWPQFFIEDEVIFTNEKKLNKFVSLNKSYILEYLNSWRFIMKNVFKCYEFIYIIWKKTSFRLQYE